jgi:TorA maturation chaperone TorD
MTDVTSWLGRAASWRFASLLFQGPRDERGQELRALASLVPDALRTRALALATDSAARADSYYEVLGPGGCPAAESAYDRAAVANRGPLIADVAAFYRAFAYPPRLTSELPPDHIAVELDFLGFLALKAAFACHDGRTEQLDVASDAYRQFLDEHPRFWIRDLCDRLTAGGHNAYAAAAEWVAALLDPPAGESAALQP